MAHLRTCVWLLLSSLILAGVPSSRAGAGLPPANVAGSYTLEVVEDTIGCRWIGRVTLRQDGENFDGTATIQLAEGNSPPCVQTLTGDVSGQVMGQQIEFGTAFSGLGSATFTGVVSPDGQVLSGEWISAELAGTWLARRIGSEAAPALGSWGLAALIGVLACAGAHRVRRRAARRPA